MRVASRAVRNDQMSAQIVKVYFYACVKRRPLVVSKTSLKMSDKASLLDIDETRRVGRFLQYLVGKSAAVG